MCNVFISITTHTSQSSEADVSATWFFRTRSGRLYPDISSDLFKEY